MYKIACYLGNRTLLNNGRTSCQCAQQHGVISNLHLAKKAKLYTVTTFKDGPVFPGRQKSAWLPMGGEDGVFL